MKKIPLFVILLMLAITTRAQSPDSSAQKLENTIRKYYFVMLLKGPNRNQDSVTAAKIQEGHLANINRLYREGKLKVAGPFGDDSGWLGIFIFDCNSQEELETLLKTDPAIAAGRIRYDIHPWYTAAIGSFAPGKPKE